MSPRDTTLFEWSFHARQHCLVSLCVVKSSCKDLGATSHVNARHLAKIRHVCTLKICLRNMLVVYETFDPMGIETLCV